MSIICKHISFPHAELFEGNLRGFFSVDKFDHEELDKVVMVGEFGGID